ncbi:MAG: arylsulfotransferase family protein [Pseudomonadota bacterium]
MNRILNFVPPLIAMAITFFLIGVGAAHYNFPPYPQILAAKRTFEVVILGRDGGSVGIPELIAWDGGDEGLGDRWTDFGRDGERPPILVNGGPARFTESCGPQGCAAVVFDGEGNIERSWPYRPLEILEADLVHDSLPHEAPTFDPMRNMRIIGAQPYGEEDLWLTMQTLGAVFPFGLGIARIGPDGTPRWSRIDFAHHWSTVLPNGDVLTPGAQIRDEPVVVRQGEGHGAVAKRLICPEGKTYYDTIDVMSGDGEVKASFDLMEAFLTSNWSGVVQATVDACDPLHLNYIHVIGPNPPAGANTGDWIVSLRNISRIAIVDHKTGALKSVVGGSFVRQHAATHLEGAEFVVFDNLGADAVNTASRILAINVETGAERVIFPREDTPEEFKNLFTERAGHIDISPDGERMLLSYTYAGVGLEIDVETGAVLSSIQNLHDLSGLDDLPSDAGSGIGRFQLHEMAYVR